MLTEKSRTTYRTLLEVQVLHHYFLDLGQPNGSILDGVSNPGHVQAQALRRLYDVRRFLRFEPDPATRALLDQHHLRLQLTREGFSLVGVAPYDFYTKTTQLVAPLPATCSFRFLWYHTDALYPLYSYLDLDELAAQQPGTRTATGQYYALDGSHFDQEADRQYLFSPQLPPVMTWAGPGKLPISALTLHHDQDGEGALHGAQGTLPATPVRYVMPLPSRSTRWLHGTDDLDVHPLLHYGGVPLPGGLPNPTAAATRYTRLNPDDDTRQLISYIY